MQGSPDAIRHTLVYAADKNSEQLDALESFIDLPVTLRENLIESYDTIQPQPKRSTTKPLSSKANCTETNWTSRLELTPTESISHHPRFRISHAAWPKCSESTTARAPATPISPDSAHRASRGSCSRHRHLLYHLGDRIEAREKAAEDA